MLCSFENRLIPLQVICKLNPQTLDMFVCVLFFVPTVIIIFVFFYFLSFCVSFSSFFYRILFVYKYCSLLHLLLLHDPLLYTFSIGRLRMRV